MERKDFTKLDEKAKAKLLDNILAPLVENLIEPEEQEGTFSN